MPIGDFEGFITIDFDEASFAIVLRYGERLFRIDLGVLPWTEEVIDLFILGSS